MVDLTISIVNTNNRDFLKACLASIYETTQAVDFEIFVVDNCSIDSSAEMVQREFPEVHLLQNQRRLGYGANHNQVLHLVQGRYVGIFNEDIVLYTGALDRMVAFMDAHPDVGMVGPRILGQDGHVYTECARQFPSLWTELCDWTGLARLFPRSRLLSGMNMRYWDYNETRDVDCLLGACMVVRAETIREVGFLDERFVMYGEDIDWPYRMRQKGWRVVFLHTAEILHYKGQYKQQQPAELNVELFRGQYELFRKHRGAVYAGAYRVLMLFVALGKLLFISGCLLRHSEDALAWDWDLARFRFQGHVFRWAVTGTYPSS